jgi:hypothetical protein
MIVIVSNFNSPCGFKELTSLSVSGHEYMKQLFFILLMATYVPLHLPWKTVPGALILAMQNCLQLLLKKTQSAYGCLHIPAHAIYVSFHDHEVAHGMTGSSSAVTVAATSPYSFSISGSTVETIETVSTRPGPVAQERPSKAADLVIHGVEACADSPCRAKDGDVNGREGAGGSGGGTSHGAPCRRHHPMRASSGGGCSVQGGPRIEALMETMMPMTEKMYEEAMGVDAGEERCRSAYGAGAKVDGGGGWVVPCASAGRGRIQRRRGHDGREMRGHP